MVDMQNTLNSNFDVLLVANRKNALVITDRVMAFALALCPILQHYKGLLMDASSTIVVLLLPYIVIRLISKNSIWLAPVIPLVLYAFYVSIIDGMQFSTFGREALLLVYFIAALNGVLDTQHLLRISVKIAELAFLCLIMQYISYYLFDVHLQMVPTSMLLDSAEQWILMAQTGRISVTGSLISFYRPSAFFLEPSHLAIYCTPLLSIMLLSGEKQRRNKISAIVISVGMLLSTSGMGIGVVVLLWSLYGIFYYGKSDSHKKIKLRDMLRPSSVIFIVFLLVVIFVLYNTVDVFQSSVDRIFIGSDAGRSAVQGRTTTGIRSLQMLTGNSLLIGLGDAFDISNLTMPGFFYTVFKYGLVGSILSYFFYAKSLFILKREYFCLTVIIIILSFFTVHTYAAFYRMYFIIILLGGYRIYSTEKNGVIRIR